MSDTQALYYSVYLRKTDELVAFGPAANCAKMLGLKNVDVFYRTMNAVRKGRNKKYEFYSEPLYSEEYDPAELTAFGLSPGSGKEGRETVH